MTTLAARMAALRRAVFRRHRLRDYTPKGLFRRSLLIIALPVALMQIAVLWMFFDSQWQTVTKRLSEGVAGDVAMITTAYRKDPQALKELAQLAMRKMDLSVALQPGESLPTGTNPALFSVLDRTLRRALQARLDAPFWFDTTRYPAYVDIRVQTRGGVLRFIAPRDKVFSTSGHVFVFWLVVATFVQMSIAILFIRNQVRPIQRLAEAAERFGRGQDYPGFSPSGAREVRQAARAFIEMRARIRKYVDQRTAMLAGVSHDLRTPLTRLKLHLAMSADSEAAAGAREDVREMERMLDGYLAFARSETEEPGEALDLGDLARGCVAAAQRGGAEIEVHTGDGLVLNGRREALRRCIANLVDNAVRYGRHVRVEAARRGDVIELAVEDDGPGIDESLHEEAFRPFNRLDPARNLNTGGIGLGLSIARDAARAHGGEITLERSDMGGLRAALRLPVRAQD